MNEDVTVPRSPDDQPALDHQPPEEHSCQFHDSLGQDALASVSPASMSPSLLVRTHLTECLSCLDDFVRLQRLAFPHASDTGARVSRGRRLVRGVIARRKRLVLVTSVVALLVLLPVAYFVSKEPPRYQAVATVLLEARSDRVQAFGDLWPGKNVLVQLLSTRSLAEAVVDSLPRASLQELLETSYRASYWHSVRDIYRGWQRDEGPPPGQRRRALTELQQARVTFQPSPDEDGVVKIAAVASRPEIAVELVNAYVEALISQTRTFNLDDVRVSREALEQQLIDVKRTLEVREQALQAFFAAHGEVRLPDESRAVADRLALTEGILAETVSSRRMVLARLVGVRGKVGGQMAGPTAATEYGMNAPEVQRLRNELVRLESRFLDLRAEYGEEHRETLLVKNQIEARIISLGDALRESVVSTPSPAAAPTAERVTLSEHLITLEATYQSLLAREEALLKLAEVLRQDLTDLSVPEAEYARLLREAESQRNLADLLSGKLTAARGREQSQLQLITAIDVSHPVTVVDAALPVPIGSEARMIACTIAFVGALGLGALAAGAREARVEALGHG